MLVSGARVLVALQKATVASARSGIGEVVLLHFRDCSLSLPCWGGGRGHSGRLGPRARVFRVAVVAEFVIILGRVARRLHNFCRWSGDRNTAVVKR